MSHSITLSTAEFERDLVAADAILTKFAQPKWLRPAGGWYDAAMIKVARKYNYQVALGSIFPYDTNISSSWFASQFILANARAGGIIVLHDSGNWGKNTAQTLDWVLPLLKQQGYKIVSLAELFAGSS
jgi:peptidoglycan-N-acetylglucosamine deacetylase